MGRYLTRTQNQETEPSAEYSIAVPDDAAVYDRLRTAANYILEIAGKANASRSHIGYKFGAKLMTEMLSDLKDSGMPPVFLEYYLKQLGSMMLWTATGTQDPDLPWPEDFNV